MICISIAQESRRLALVDMLNAAKQCDLVEIRLDRFGKAPDIGELLAHKPKPVILSCHRGNEGGQWDGTEEERLSVLRHCIVNKADYVEIELDVADQIRRYGPTKRVITYTNLQETPADIAEIYATAQSKNPDVIKLVTLARTPEEAWPLLRLVASAPLPTVVVGMGKPGVMLSILGKKIGAPWTYAALEKGMEAYPGQPTGRELQEVYHYDQIDKSTRLIGVAGFGERQYFTTAVMNHALAHLGLGMRCLPIGVGNIALFRKILDAVHVRGVVVDEEHYESILAIVSESEADARDAQAVDLLLPTKEKEWQGHNTLGRAALASLEKRLEPHSLEGRLVMIAGVNAAARSMARRVRERGGVVIVASHERDKALALAQALECRHVQFEGLYTTMHDVLIVCDEEKDYTRSKRGPKGAGIHPGYLRAGMTVMDLTAKAAESGLLGAAKARGCAIVEPEAVLGEQLLAQLQLITGKQVPSEIVGKKLDQLVADRS
jgi:3-dehydroquinate dehydratase/shikimate dehydrogenase